MTTATMTTLPLRAAAARLGVDADSLRKRLRRGTVPGRKVDGVWHVDVPDGVQATGQDVRDDGPDGGQATSGTALAAARAEEMARYTAVLLAPLHEQLKAQAEEIGALRAMLVAVTQSGPPVQGGRGWWRRFWGLT